MPLIDLPTIAGPVQAHLTGVPEQGSRPGVLFLTDAIGLRPTTAGMADRIADLGYIVLAPNIFHRAGTVEQLEPTTDLRLQANRDAFRPEIFSRVEGLTPSMFRSDLPTYLAALRVHTAGPLAVVGYCVGARLAVEAAADFPDEIVAVAGFHGGGLVTDDPDSPHHRLASARAEFIFGHARHDHGMTESDVEELGSALRGAGLTHKNEIYPAEHGFTMADTAPYDEGAGERAFEELRALLARTLSV